jgi:hypothetical protein
MPFIPPVQGDPNITVDQKPHGGVIADRLRAILADPQSTPEERESATTFLDQFWKDK